MSIGTTTSKTRRYRKRRRAELELETRLDPRRFARIHRATIVNIGFVQELYPGVDGMLARLKDEPKTELNVARDRVRDLKERLGI